MRFKKNYTPEQLRQAMKETPLPSDRSASTEEMSVLQGLREQTHKGMDLLMSDNTLTSSKVGIIITTLFGLVRLLKLFKVIKD